MNFDPTNTGLGMYLWIDCFLIVGRIMSTMKQTVIVKYSELTNYFLVTPFLISKLHHLNELSHFKTNGFADHRKGDFKKTVGAVEGRRRRAGTTLKIRKQKKEQQLKKKRAGALSTPVETPAFATSLNEQLDSLKDAKPTLDDAPRLKSILTSPVASESNLVEATRGLRRILSVEKNIPARELVSLGIVPYLVRNLATSSPKSSTSLIFESAWALTNIASTECTMDVVDAGCIKPLVQLLLHADANIREQAAWCLGNIAGEGPALRDMVLQESALEPL